MRAEPSCMGLVLLKEQTERDNLPSLCNFLFQFLSLLKSIFCLIFLLLFSCHCGFILVFYLNYHFSWRINQNVWSIYHA